MNIYSVTQIARYLQEMLEVDPVLGDIWIQGELSNVRRSANGHLYFTLKDGGAEFRCVMFKSALTATVSAADGAAVVAHGRFSFYEARGDLQFKVDVLMPQGVGALHLEFEQLKAKLQAEGLFDHARKRPLPEFPRRIAVLTSPSGAVLHDIVNVIGRRYPLVELLLVPVMVQGDAASQSIAAAFAALGQVDGLDLVILARGGGSIEELWPFNEEMTARAIYGCRVPVVSAVGHETDVTIADLVADVRAPTPSAAAELAVPSSLDLARRITGYAARAQQVVAGQLDGHRGNLMNIRRRFLRAAPDLDRRRQAVDDLSRTAARSLLADLRAQRSALAALCASLAALDPQRTLERGYAIVSHAGGGVVRQRVEVTSGEALAVQVSDGVFDAVATGGRIVPPVRKTRPSPQEQLALFGG